MGDRLKDSNRVGDRLYQRLKAVDLFAADLHTGWLCCRPDEAGGLAPCGIGTDRVGLETNLLRPKPFVTMGFLIVGAIAALGIVIASNSVHRSELGLCVAFRLCLAFFISEHPVGKVLVLGRALEPTARPETARNAQSP